MIFFNQENVIILLFLYENICCGSLVDASNGHPQHLGLAARKPVFGGLQTAKAQTSLRIHAD